MTDCLFTHAEYSCPTVHVECECSSACRTTSSAPHCAPPPPSEVPGTSPLCPHPYPVKCQVHPHYALTHRGVQGLNDMVTAQPRELL